MKELRSVLTSVLWSLAILLWVIPGADAQPPAKQNETAILPAVSLGQAAEAPAAEGSAIAELLLDMDFTKASGAAFPFALKDVEGNVVSLAQFKGKVVLLGFWTTW